MGGHDREFDIMFLGRKLIIRGGILAESNYVIEFLWLEECCMTIASCMDYLVKR